MPRQPETWTYDQVIEQFRQVRSDQVATILSRRNPGVNAWGVRFGDIDKIAKRIMRDSGLARQLWASGILEARFLACHILDPADLTEAEIDRWIDEVDYPYLADALAGVVYRTPFADAKREAWAQSSKEYARRAGFSLVYNAAADPRSDLPDARFLAYLDQIQTEIHGSPNWSREMMNLVPIAIGKRNEALYGPALNAAKTYGKIDVFHGDKTNCKIWDAAEALQDPRTRVKAP
jgi:3-methyladenine DNA glycosylase AlkD